VVEKKGLKYVNKYYEEAKKSLTKNFHTTVDDRESKVVVEDRKLKMDKSNLSSIFYHQPPSSIFYHPSSLENIFKTAHQISPDWHVRMQAAFQKYTDNAVSKTINFPGNATISDIKKAYMLAWELGCKGITVYRDGSREGQVLKMTNDELKMTNEKPNIIQHSTFNIQHSANRLMQSQMKITPLSQRAYRVERQQITDDLSDGHCPECGVEMTSESGCSTCYSCGYSKCSL